MADQSDPTSGPEQKPPAKAGEPETYEVIEPPSAPAKPSASISAPKLLSDFDEDADFDHDPAVKAAQGKVKVGPPLIEGEDDDDVFVKPGLGDERLWAIVGVVLMIASVIATLVFKNEAAGNTAWRAILVGAQCFVHAGTGVAAIGAAASLGQMRLGKVELAAARMFALVGLFQLIFHLNLPITNSKVEEIVLAGMAYLIGLRVLFRRPNDQTMIIAGFHFLGWLAVYLIGFLYAAANQPAVTTS